MDIEELKQFTKQIGWSFLGTTDGRTVEPVFGQIKDVRGFDRFMRRGIEACRSEWSLICATHNLLKLWRSSKACWN